MVYQRVAHYLWLKGDAYYFNRRVPKDMQGHYKASRIIICLKTSRKDTAVRSAKSIAQSLEDYWLSLRLSKIDVPAFTSPRDKPVANPYLRVHLIGAIASLFLEWLEAKFICGNIKKD